MELRAAILWSEPGARVIHNTPVGVDLIAGAVRRGGDRRGNTKSARRNSGTLFALFAFLSVLRYPAKSFFLFRTCSARQGYIAENGVPVDVMTVTMASPGF